MLTLNKLRSRAIANIITTSLTRNHLARQMVDDGASEGTITLGADINTGDMMPYSLQMPSRRITSCRAMR
jgi:hypothetical protein